MTFIQPHKSITQINIILGIFAVACVFGTFMLIAMYNGVVNTNQNIASAKAQIDQLGAQSTNLSNQIVASLGYGAAQSVAVADGLVEDNNPKYFETDQQWAFASQ